MHSNLAMTTRDLTRLTGVKRETLRFYERRALITAPERTAGGYRLFPPETVERLEFIRTAKILGFSLKEIRGLLAVDGGAAQPCDAIAAEAREKLEDVERRIRLLIELKLKLKQTIARCDAKGGNASCGAACLIGDS